MDKRPFYDKVRAINSKAKEAGIMDMELDGRSAKTVQVYSGIWLKHKSRAIEHMSDEVSRASWGVHRAAMKLGASTAYRAMRKQQDAAQKAGDLDRAGIILDAMQKMLDTFVAVDALEKPQEGSRRASKRKSVPKAGKWREVAFRAATEVQRKGIAVMWATGCRPAELEKGVEVDTDGETILITVQGAKVSELTGAGQEWRRIEIDRQSVIGRLLVHLIGDRKIETVTRRASRVRKDLDAVSAKTGLKLCPYTYRHQFAADMKAAGDRTATAQAMGHVTTRSQSRYGSTAQAKGGRSVVATSASRDVRVVEHEPLPSIMASSPAPAGWGPVA